MGRAGPLWVSAKMAAESFEDEELSFRLSASPLCAFRGQELEGVPRGERANVSKNARAS